MRAAMHPDDDNESNDITKSISNTDHISLAGLHVDNINQECTNRIMKGNKFSP